MTTYGEVKKPELSSIPFKFQFSGAVTILHNLAYEGHLVTLCSISSLVNKQIGKPHQQDSPCPPNVLHPPSLATNPRLERGHWPPIQLAMAALGLCFPSALTAAQERWWQKLLCSDGSLTSSGFTTLPKHTWFGSHKSPVWF